MSSSDTLTLQTFTALSGHTNTFFGVCIFKFLKNVCKKLIFNILIRNLYFKINFDLEKTMLWQAFAALEKTELRDFGKFVRSPFFNSKNHLVLLFEGLKNGWEKKMPPDPLEIFSQIFPANKTFDDQKMRLANSDLLALLEHFWMYREKFNDADRAKIRLAGAYRKRNLDKHFQITLKSARSARESQPHRHADFFHDLNLIEWEKYQFDSAARRSDSMNLQELSDLTDQTFIIRKLRLACLTLSHQAVYRTDYDFGLLDSVLDFLENRNDIFSKNVISQPLPPAIQLYFHGFYFLAGRQPEQHFSIFKEKLFAYADLFPEDELRTLFLLAINFGVKKINERAAPFFRETLDLYQNALARNLLLENGQLSRFAFNNIVAIALRLDETVWTADFIEKYSPFLEKKHRQATRSLNLARLNFVRRDFGAALQNLQLADYKDLINNLISRTLQLKIYFESSEFDLLESHLAGMKTFIRRQSELGYHRENYLNVVKYARLLVALPDDEIARVALRQKIEDEPNLMEKEWFLEMI